VGLPRDAWSFFTMLLLYAAVIFVLMPARLVDRWLGTRAYERLLPILEAIAER
jgi:hypothetical protein